MCTIGVLFNEGNIFTFKQCDLIPSVQFNEPEYLNIHAQEYISLNRGSNDSKRMWAGVNSVGLSFVAADAYTESALYNLTKEDTDSLFEAYESSINKFTNPIDASKFLEDFYLGTDRMNQAFPAPDIVMHTGYKDNNPIAVFLEYMPGPYNRKSVRRIIREDGYFVSTNHFRIQPEAITYPYNHSTYLRLSRAESILQSNPTLEGVRNLLKDEYYGETELSICRSTSYTGQEFYTQASVIFNVSLRQKPICEYQINGNPKNNPLKEFKY